MPQTQPSTAIWSQSAQAIGTDIATIKAIFEVEAAGRFFESSGKVPRRFEPHHFPEPYWSRIGFKPGRTSPWRASLALSTRTRRAMFDKAELIDAEAAYAASSLGAPQIMGFNHKLAGYDSATQMVHDFEQSADNQILAFLAFCDANGLSTHMRSQNWLAFASGYNGNGQAPVYAQRIESAYRRQSGGTPSSATMRVGTKGDHVRELQTRLSVAGYEVVVDGDFGFGTEQAVRKFQNDNNLTVDGIAGAVTQRTLDSVAKALTPIQLTTSTMSPTSLDGIVDKVIERGTAVVGSGGLLTLVGGLSDTTQAVLVGGLFIGAIVLGGLWIMRNKK